MLLSSGKFGIIESVRAIQYGEPRTTYNFEVAEYHTYFVSETGVLVHNDCITDELTKIAEKYHSDLMNTKLPDQQRFLCDKAAEEMETFLKGKGVAYERVNIRYEGSGKLSNVYSDKLQMTISTNNYHTGIKLLGKYNGLVFDNVHVTGISYSNWLADFSGFGARL